MVTHIDRPMVRRMRPDDAVQVITMACELAAVVGDAAPVLAESQLIKDSYGPDRWFDCLVAEVANQLVGYAVVCRAFEAHTGKKRLWLGDLYVRSSARNGGAGTALMAEIARHALQLGCDAVYWELWRMNVRGGVFYRKLAAEEAGDLAVMYLGKEQLMVIASAH